VAIAVSGDVSNTQQTLLHLGLGEILIAVVHRFEFRAVDGDTGFPQQSQRAAQFDELPAHLLDRCATLRK
jgi:hypothetical protein